MRTFTNNGMIRILPGNAGISDYLEARPYQLLYSEQDGPYLVPATLQDAAPVFGPINGKETKVFEAYDRHPGIILSGEKGLGKSLFSRRLAHMAMKRGMPVILVDNRAKNIATFIATLDQPSMFLLDEFEKNFKIRDMSNGDEDTGAQLQFLSLLDGTDGAKRLVIITCNDTSDLSQFFMDRPGRFYYHFQFRYPTADEAEEFIRYCGLEGHDDEVTRLAALGTLIGFSYDALRAIVEELKAGYTLDETLADLNVAGRCQERTADVKVAFKDGVVCTGYCSLDFADEWSDDFELYIQRKRGNTRRQRADDIGNLVLRINALRETGDGVEKRYVLDNPNENVKWSWYDTDKVKATDEAPPEIDSLELVLRPLWTFKGGLQHALGMFM